MIVTPLALDERSATFSPCRTYRYSLRRRWSDGPTLNVIGLNPSTADETVDDPTIRRCIGFAKSWGFGALIMTNLLAFRATDPRVMEAADDPIGPENWETVVRVATESDFVLAAWGANKATIWAWSHLELRLPYALVIWCLGLTKHGAPRHPLYVPGATKPVMFRKREAQP